MAGPQLTASRARHLLHYSPTTGLFFWINPQSKRVRVGDIAGSPHCKGYVQIKVDGEVLLAHRVAWLHFYGEWPQRFVDHRNGDKCDNRITNLRDVTFGENMQNLRKPSARNNSGFLGVSWSEKDGVWAAHISVDNVSQYLGCSHDPREAYALYVAAKRRLHSASTL